MNWDLKSDRPIYIQLVEHLQLAIISGLLPPGSRVPPVRELAAEAAVNPNTMQKALQELEQSGLVHQRAHRHAGRRPHRRRQNGGRAGRGARFF